VHFFEDSGIEGVSQVLKFSVIVKSEPVLLKEKVVSVGLIIHPPVLLNISQITVLFVKYLQPEVSPQNAAQS